MKQGIVVCTWSGGQPWAHLCIESLIPIYGKYPIYVAINDIDNADNVWINAISKYVNIIGIRSDYRELGVIRSILKNTDLDEFWFFQDSVEITDTFFIGDTFENHPGETATYMNNYMQFYLGKWKTNILKELDIPEPKDKMEAVKYELDFANKYFAADAGNKSIIVDPSMRYDDKRTNYMDTLFEEDRLAVVGKFLIKRISIVKENMRDDSGEFMSDEDIEEWKKIWRKMINP
jgi:hypothetical protein